MTLQRRLQNGRASLLLEYSDNWPQVGQGTCGALLAEDLVAIFRFTLKVAQSQVEGYRTLDRAGPGDAIEGIKPDPE